MKLVIVDDNRTTQRTTVVVAPHPPLPGGRILPAAHRTVLSTSSRRIDLSLPIDGYGGALAPVALR